MQAIFELALTSLGQTLIHVLQLMGAILLVNGVLYFLDKQRMARLHAIPLTGYIGVPVHEFAHLLMCIVFRYDIRKVVLLKNPTEDGILGYVNFRYNENSVVDNVGIFFTSVAPVMLGGIFIYGGTFWIVAEDVKEVMRSLLFGDLNFDNILQSMQVVGQAVLHELVTFNGIAFLIIIVLICIASHMTLSPPDLAGALQGGITILIVLFILNFLGLSQFISNVMTGVSSFFVITSSFALVYGVIGYLLHILFYKIVRYFW